MRGNRAEPGLWRPEIEAGFAGTASWAGIGCYVAIMALATLAFWCWYRAQEAARVRASAEFTRNLDIPSPGEDSNRADAR